MVDSYQLLIAVALAIAIVETHAFPEGIDLTQNDALGKERKGYKDRYGRPGDNPDPDQTTHHTEKWGYTDVRPGVHMFWWLYYSTHPDGYERRPWILWIQGGPGLSGTALGNFAEIGPFNYKMKPRRYTWVKTASVVFVDNPVGTGFSYLDDIADVAGGVKAISADLLQFMHAFLRENPQFKTRPLYIFGQSYGGKMTSHFAYTLSQAVSAGSIQVDLKGIGLGNSFVSPYHMTTSMGDFLHQLSMIDSQTHKQVMAQTEAFKSSLKDHRDGLITYEKVEELFYKVYGLIDKNSGGGYYDFYNVMDLRRGGNSTRRRRSTPTMLYRKTDRLVFDSIYSLDMAPLMEGYVRKKLGIIPDQVQWQGQEGEVYVAQTRVDFYDDVIYTVDWLLKNTDLQVAVYEGQLDVACTSSGAEDWVDTLQWSGLELYQRANRTALLNPVTNELEMFVKAHGQLKFYWIINSGHAVPADRPDTGYRLVNRILTNVDI